MKKQQNIRLTILRERLQSRLYYDDPDFAFEVLLYGWCKHRGHSTNWLSDVKRRGWLSIAMARDFETYCGYQLL
ncbi:MAG: hypothetical protein II825_05545 [Paludibacteraceae bacterium]|nr:hypothetical protein [Paludibacteraceae bacterium]